MNRKVDYAWRLAEIMAAHGMHNSTSFPDSLNEVSSSPDRRCIASFINGQNDCRCSYWQHCATS